MRHVWCKMMRCINVFQPFAAVCTIAMGCARASGSEGVVDPPVDSVAHYDGATGEPRVVLHDAGRVEPRCYCETGADVCL